MFVFNDAAIAAALGVSLNDLQEMQASAAPGTILGAGAAAGGTSEAPAPATAAPATAAPATAAPATAAPAAAAPAASSAPAPVAPPKGQPGGAGAGAGAGAGSSADSEEVAVAVYPERPGAGRAAGVGAGVGVGAGAGVASGGVESPVASPSKPVSARPPAPPAKSHARLVEEAVLAAEVRVCVRTDAYVDACVHMVRAGVLCCVALFAPPRFRWAAPVSPGSPPACPPCVCVSLSSIFSPSTDSLSQARTCSLTHMYTLTPMRTHAHVHSHTHAPSHTCTLSHTCAHTHMYTLTHMRTHAHEHSHTHAHIRPRPRGPRIPLQGRLGDALFDASASMLPHVPRLSPSPALRPVTGGAVVAVLDRDAVGSAAAAFVVAAVVSACQGSPAAAGASTGPGAPQLFALHLRPLPGRRCPMAVPQQQAVKPPQLRAWWWGVALAADFFGGDGTHVLFVCCGFACRQLA
jgi:hypothetical protein